MNMFASLAEPLRCRPGDVLPAPTRKPRSYSAKLDRSAIPPSEQNPWGITGRECEILKLVIADNTAKQIGVLLGLSDKTIEKHTQHLRERMGVRTMLQAALLWDRHFRL